ncbi:MAG: PEP-utilizing enzyme [Acidimicrobiales bacterium]
MNEYTVHGGGEEPDRHVRCGRRVLRGWAASTGIAAGRVRVVTSATEASGLRPGEVLVAPMTTPRWVPAMRRAAAVVTDRGGMTYAALAARDLGLPCVVGAREATSLLRDGDLVIVDGGRGLVFAGELTSPPALTPPPTADPPAGPVDKRRLAHPMLAPGSAEHYRPATR